jgi:glycosyltransferase involved in cell wall biosynthesis
MIYERHVSKEIEMRNDFSMLKKFAIKFKWFIMEKLAKKFNHFIVLTEGNKKEWPSLRNMMVIPNPLSFYPEKSSQLTNKKVIAVGKQSYQKGYDLLLPAWKLVVEKHPDWQLEIYGKKEPLLKLSDQADALNIGNNVFFFDPVQNIVEKYLESSIYVMSSRFEGFGMVLIEAMACGVPCVSFNCNYGPADIIQDGIDGFIIENGNIRLLAERINVLIEDTDLRKKIGLNAKENVKRYFPAKIINQWDDLFKDIRQ